MWQQGNVILSETHNIIELNGKKYNALTGRLLGEAPLAAKPTQKPKPRGSKFVDSFVRTTPVPVEVRPAATRPQPVAPPPAQPVQARTVMDIKRPAAPSVRRHNPQHASTLMRSAVRKPEPSLKRHVKAQTRTDILAKSPAVLVAPKLSSQSISPARLARAKRIAKHRMVTRFGNLQIAAPVPLKSAGAYPHILPAATSGSKSYTPPQLATARPPHSSKNKDASPTKKPSMDIFERAIAEATSHQQPKPADIRHSKARKSRLVGSKVFSTIAVIAVIVLLGGFIAYQNKANLTMRLASSRAGIAADLPTRVPAGFSAGKFSYSPGVVSIAYTGVDNRRFAIVQRASAWDSSALLSDYVASAQRPYQKFESAGRTIFVFANNDATWVSHGIWYQIQANGSLSTNDLINIASSM